MNIEATDKHGISITEEFFGKIWKWCGRDVRKTLPSYPHGIAVNVYALKEDGSQDTDKLLDGFIIRNV